MTTTANQYVLLTGPGGFLGRAVLDRFAADKVPVRGIGRADIGDIHRGTDWGAVLKEVPNAIIHLANRAHIMRDSGSGADRLEAFREVNLHGTVALAEQARDAGVKRFVFVSSLKALGESGLDLAPNAPVAPADPYAISKVEAEMALREIAGDMEVIILRPPLIYGPGVKANFLALMKAVDRGIPLPFGAIRNARSLVHVANMADAIHASLSLPPGIYHPRDAEQPSTPELVAAIGRALGRPTRLLPVPVWILKGMGAVTGKGEVIARLTGDFTSDGAMGGWRPPFGMADGLRATAEWYRSRV